LCEEAIAITRDIGWAPGEVFANITRDISLVYTGDYARALPATRETLRLAEELEHRQWITGAVVNRGYLLLDVLGVAGAQAEFERALALAREIQSWAWIANSGAGLAVALAQRGRTTQADALIADLQPGRLPGTNGAALLLRARAEVALLRGSPAEALDITHELMAQASARATQRDDGATILPRVLKLQGEALFVLHRDDAALAALNAARAAAASVGARPLVWRIDAALGRVLARLRQRSRAEEAFDRARTEVHELAAGIDDPELRAAFLSGSSALVPARQPLTPRRAAQQHYAGLTDREREVAAMILGGSSNRQIAARLVVSERTVESHVRRILNRLGFESRAQIAAWAQANEIVSSSENA
jgi:DNA-binding CsgD family transcriptional regulator